MGSEELVRTLYDGSYRRLVGQLTTLTGSRVEAEEVVQEAFVRALSQGRRFLTVDNPEAWLRTVAVNQARSRWRRFRRLTGLLPDLLQEQEEALAPDRITVLAAVRSLPRPQREAIALHHLCDLPVAEVAATLGVPIGTVKARLSRGRAALARLLDEEPESRTPEEARRG